MTEKEISDKMQTASDYEYSTLMQLLGVSVSKHLLDDHFTLIWANDFYYQLIDWPKDEYEAIFHNRPDLYYEYMDCQEEWQKLGKTVMKALEEHQSGYKMVSRLRRKGGEDVWVQFSAQFAQCLPILMIWYVPRRSSLSLMKICRVLWPNIELKKICV